VSGELEVMEGGDAEAMRASLERPEAFEPIFDRHHRVIWAYLARLGGRDRADELAGEVFLVAFTPRASYDPTRGSVRSWLYGIASNLTRNRLRSDARAARAFRRAAARQGGMFVPIDDADDALAGRQRFDAVVAALARLPFADREIVALFAWERLSYDEIAATLGIEVGTVRSRLSRARGRLRELVAANDEFTDEVT
jgi:RNA polymerase sigma factor (sigma-70 family)